MGSMTAEHVRDRLEAAGYLVVADEMDEGVLRAYQEETAGDGVAYSESWRTLSGLIVIRGERVSYAEFTDRVFAFWPTMTPSGYESRVESLWREIDKHPAT